MTAREIDMLKEFLGREIQELGDAIHSMREEAKADHLLVRAEIRALSKRVDVLEDTEVLDKSRRDFRKGLVRWVIAANAAAAVATSTAFLLIDHL